MSIKSDLWITRMARQRKMIEPFEEDQISMGKPLEGFDDDELEKKISYGVSSYGYDIRVSDEYEIFTNQNSYLIDPKDFNPKCLQHFQGAECIIPPNSFALARSVEYFRIPRNVITVCLGKSTYARCFTGDTHIALVDGTCPTLEELSKRTDNYYGYGINPTTGKIVVAELSNAICIGTEEILEICLDNGSRIQCTPDHKFMLNSSWTSVIYKEASELHVGESLRALYRRHTHGYENVLMLPGKVWIPTYVFSDDWNILHNVYEYANFTDKHHIDCNKVNNNPNNICRMLSSEHAKFHNDLYYGELFDAQLHSDRIKNGISHLKDNEDWNEIQRQRANNFWHNPEYACARQERSNSLRASWTDERRAAMSERMRLHNPRSKVNHKITSIKRVSGKYPVYCLNSETGNFALDAGVFVHNCGIVVNITALEPEWEGNITIEISNTTPLPVKIYSMEGIAQILFFESDEICRKSYKDKNGKYQGQTGITLAK